MRLPALAVLFMACSLGEPVTCTGIGCSDALVVELEGAVSGAYTIEVRALGQVHRFSCTEASLCNDAVFPGFTPAEVTVRVEWSGGELEEVFSPQYEAVQPNGPDCPPVCQLAVVTVAIPG